MSLLLAIIGSTGSGHTPPPPTAAVTPVPNADGTYTLTGPGVIANSDGTYTVSGDNVIANTDQTYTIGG